MEKLTRYVCQNCGRGYTKEDYTFKTLFSPNVCPDCEHEQFIDSQS